MGGVLTSTPHLFCGHAVLTVQTIHDWIDAYAPFRYAQTWDHCGLQAGDPTAAVERLLVALDPSSTTIAEAQRRRCQCLVTHHPLIFTPLDAVRTDRYPANLVIQALLAGVNVIAAHTNLDVARGGTNDQLSSLLALRKVSALEVDAAWQREESYVGMGCIGFLPDKMRLGDLREVCAERLRVSSVRLVGDASRPVQKVALCTGSGGSLLERVVSAGVDVYITGDIKYHDAQRAVEEDLTLIDIGHFGSERIIVEPLAAYFRSRAKSENTVLEVFAASAEKDPFAPAIEFFGT